MKRVFTLLLCVLLAAMPLVGCTGESGQLDADKIRIALVCREGMDYNVSRYQKGMEMALGEYEGPYLSLIHILWGCSPGSPRQALI